MTGQVERNAKKGNDYCREYIKKNGNASPLRGAEKRLNNKHVKKSGEKGGEKKEKKKAMVDERVGNVPLAPKLYKCARFPQERV